MRGMAHGVGEIRGREGRLSRCCKKGLRLTCVFDMVDGLRLGMNCHFWAHVGLRFAIQLSTVARRLGCPPGWRALESLLLTFWISCAGQDVSEQFLKKV